MTREDYDKTACSQCKNRPKDVVARMQQEHSVVVQRSMQEEAEVVCCFKMRWEKGTNREYTRTWSLNC